MKIKNAIMGDTGNGPCIEIQMDDKSYIWVSYDGGCGLPVKDSWSVGHYDSNNEMINTWNQDDGMRLLWRGQERDPDMSDPECKALIISEMVKWGFDSFSNGCSAQDTWMAMMKEMDFNLDFLSNGERSMVQALIAKLIDNA